MTKKDVLRKKLKITEKMRKGWEKVSLEELNEKLEVLNSETRELENKIADNISTIIEV